MTDTFQIGDYIKVESKYTDFITFASCGIIFNIEHEDNRSILWYSLPWESPYENPHKTYTDAEVIISKISLEDMKSYELSYHIDDIKKINREISSMTDDMNELHQKIEIINKYNP